MRLSARFRRPRARNFAVRSPWGGGWENLGTRVGVRTKWKNYVPMEAALLIASLALLIGMLSQLVLLPRRQRAANRRIEAAPQPGGTAPGRLAVADQKPALH